MTQPAAKMFYEFSEFRLDIQQRLLSAGADGRPIPLPPKAFETLLYFVERRGELLDKNTLMKAVWPNVIVEENSLNQNISVIRRALGESPSQHRFIVTEPGRGYRFVADVRVVSHAGRSEPAAPTAVASGPATRSPATATAAQRKSIAVLPFANLTGDPSKEYFGDGMSEELLHRLARIPGLKVPSRTSSFAYKGRNMDVRQIARDLDVGVVLEGSVRSAGDRIRVTAQLIDGQNGFHLWSQNYDREFGDLFALQDELAHAIINTLRITLDGQVNAAVVVGAALHEPPTRDLEAYRLYLQAMSMQMIGAPSSVVPRTVALLEQAIARDPGFSRAHNALASLRAMAIVLSVPLPGTLADTEREILRGTARDPSLGSMHAALGIIYAAQGKWISAEERFLEAFARDEQDPSTHQSYGMLLLGSLGFARRYLESVLEAHRLAPVWLGGVINIVVAHAILDQDDEARKYAELCIDLGLARNSVPLADVLSQLELRGGRHEAAGELMVAALPAGLAADGGAETVSGLFQVLRDGAGGGAEIAALDALRDRMASTEIPHIMHRRFMVWYTMLGALDQAFDMANQSLDHFARSGSIGMAWALLWLNEMLPFRQDPRFQSICRRMGMFEYWNKHGAPDNCELRGDQLICR
jgi:TolB-like protein